MQPQMSLAQPVRELERRNEQGNRAQESMRQQPPFHFRKVLPYRGLRVQKRHFIAIENEKRHQSVDDKEDRLDLN